jgi:hypothetical protein
VEAGRLGREADDRPEEPRALRGLLERVALTKGSGRTLRDGDALAVKCGDDRGSEPLNCGLM